MKKTADLNLVLLNCRDLPMRTSSGSIRIKPQTFREFFRPIIRDTHESDPKWQKFSYKCGSITGGGVKPKQGGISFLVCMCVWSYYTWKEREGMWHFSVNCVHAHTYVAITVNCIF